MASYLLSTIYRNVACDTFHIISSPGDNCPALSDKCYTLQQYADHPLVRSNITLELQPGNHNLNSTLMLTTLDNVADFRMTSTNGSVICSGEDMDTRGRISLSGVQNVYIGQLTFKDCYNNKIEEVHSFISEDSTFLEGNFIAWQFNVTTNILVQRCLFSHILSSVLVIQDRESNVTVKSCNFISNGADIGG